MTQLQSQSPTFSAELGGFHPDPPCLVCHHKLMSRSHWTNYEKNFMLKYFNLFFIETSYLYLCLKSNLVGFPKILQKSSPDRSQYFASKLVNICIFIVFSFFFVQYCDKKCYVAKRSKSIHCHVVNYIIFFSLSFYSKQ